MIPVIAWVVGGVAAAFYVDAKVKPLGLSGINPLAHKKIDAPAPAGAPAATVPNFVPSVNPGIRPGTGTVDGHGTGVLSPLPAGVTAPDFTSAASAAAANIQGLIAAGMVPTTPSGNQTPEQLAFLNLMGGSPEPPQPAGQEQSPEQLALLRALNRS